MTLQETRNSGRLIHHINADDLLDRFGATELFDTLETRAIESGAQAYITLLAHKQTLTAKTCEAQIPGIKPRVDPNVEMLSVPTTYYSQQLEKGILHRLHYRFTSENEKGHEVIHEPTHSVDGTVFYLQNGQCRLDLLRTLYPDQISELQTFNIQFHELYIVYGNYFEKQLNLHQDWMAQLGVGVNPDLEHAAAENLTPKIFRNAKKLYQGMQTSPIDEEEKDDFVSTIVGLAENSIHYLHAGPLVVYSTNNQEVYDSEKSTDSFPMPKQEPEFSAQGLRDLGDRLDEPNT